MNPNHAANGSTIAPATPAEALRPTDTQEYDNSQTPSPAEDPFAQPAVSPDQEANAKTPVPSTPEQNIQQPLPPSPPVGKPLETNDIPAPPQPAAVPLQPAAAELQTWIEPGPWRRLDTPNSNSLVIQPRGYNAQPTSWQQQ